MTIALAALDARDHPLAYPGVLAVLREWFRSR